MKRKANKFLISLVSLIGLSASIAGIAVSCIPSKPKTSDPKNKDKDSSKKDTMKDKEKEKGKEETPKTEGKEGKQNGKVNPDPKQKDEETPLPDPFQIPIITSKESTLQVSKVEINNQKTNDLFTTFNVVFNIEKNADDKSKTPYPLANKRVVINLKGNKRNYWSFSLDQNTNTFEVRLDDLQKDKQYTIERIVVTPDNEKLNLSNINASSLTFTSKSEGKKEPEKKDKGEGQKQGQKPGGNLPDGQIPQFDINEFNRQKREREIKNNTYPSHASLFKKVDRTEIYKEIFDRTFALDFGSELGHKLDHESSSNNFLSTVGGTGWLLDYHKYSNHTNKYKLFIATNMHVINMFGNTLPNNMDQQFNTVDPTGNKAVAIALGKVKETVDLNPRPNNTRSRYKAIYYTNDQRLSSSDTGNSKTFHDTKQTNAISKPKLVFAGFDFIDQKYTKKTSDHLLDLLKNKDTKDSSDEERLIYEYAKKNDKHIPSYTDFGVIEVDVDLTKADETLKKFVMDAVQAVDRYLTRLKNTATLPNQDKTISKYMQTTDYVSASRDKTNKNNLWSSKDVYVGGYPRVEEVPYWDINNPTERTSTATSAALALSYADTFGLPSAETAGENVTTNNVNLYTSVFGRVLGSIYGYSIPINFSSLYYGASGSVVYNEFGQMIGVYSSVSSNVEQNDHLRYSAFTPFLLSKQVPGVSGNENLEAYNLIDGSDKNKYPHQTRSFRENLKKLYPNGFSDETGKLDTDKKTALFDSGI
ncbi:MIP family Ig-specific serine endopeptidase [Ureaplasma canigenitalium]|uniref:MIP family Ig-specific serine endopeptidase n=1 Tax=Ureaplasma canigenitalium TaxID=42092 RepID=UPI00068A4E55|nr:DUF31 family protein [Ureaplasma canigenitalium]